MQNSIGDDLYKFCEDLFPICRSITGNGVRKTLSYIKKNLIPDLNIIEVPSGTQCFDWTVPKEWNIEDAYIITPCGEKICSLKNSNLHVVNYSIPVDKEVELDDLQQHLFSREDLPDAIPYVTSYYKETWGFCISHKQRKSLKPGTYKVLIDSRLEPGSLTYGEYIKKGKIEDEVFFSTYVCHPSMGNNELSGPALNSHLAKFISELDNHYTYRFVFIPETIGSIVYLSKNLKALKERVFAGFNVTCVGDDGPFSFLPSRKGNTFSDRCLKTCVQSKKENVRIYTWMDRGSDERQYCSPGADLPVSSFIRSKYGKYEEYHTSLDNLDFISSEGLGNSFLLIKEMVELIENNCFPTAIFIGEPNLGMRGLYNTISKLGKRQKQLGRIICDFLSYCDGTQDLFQIMELIQQPAVIVLEVYKICKEHNLINFAEK